ncbi:hypothetical protein BBJ28_00027031 [Nothophytophthora sp. Chile5]|nr:hypothetical protein BBJ28_00026215 [Nothophytophthora sp. Chile5]RLN95867.1 hypothetical protein BBJ28_00027031 [Nothophytophthora sp. Chile5]
MQDKEPSDLGASTYISPAALRDARAAPATKRKYESCRNVIKGWIKVNLAKEEEKLKRDGKCFLDASGEIIGTQFTPAYFDEFLARKRTSVTVSTLNGNRSAMLDLYNRQRVPLPDDYDQDMAYLFSGMQREQTTHDQTSGAGTSGKESLPYSLYKELCEKTLVRSDGGLMHLTRSGRDFAVAGPRFTAPYPSGFGNTPI